MRPVKGMFITTEQVDSLNVCNICDLPMKEIDRGFWRCGWCGQVRIVSAED